MKTELKTDLKYVIVDDDPFNNIICRMILEDALGVVDTTTFTKPEEGLIYIKEHINSPTILFLDINMPKLTGWQFLEQYEEISGEIKMHINIYMLPSFLYHLDREKADMNKYVKGFISKPLDFKTITTIAGTEFQL